MTNWRDYEWFATSICMPLPRTAIIGGKDEDGHTIYVGRFWCGDNLLPAEVIPQKKAAFALLNGQVVTESSFEVLIGTGLKFVACTDKEKLPKGALKVGNTLHGDPLFIGRVVFNSFEIIGKIDPSSSRVIMMRFRDREVSFDKCHCEVLVEVEVRTRWRAFFVGDQMFNDAILACHDFDGHPVYVGRAYHDMELLPASVIPDKKVAYVTYNGCEYPKYGVEVLCGGKVHWSSASLGQIPTEDAVIGGQTANGENLYIGRVNIGNGTFMGKIQPFRKRLFISTRDGYEVAQRLYEVLIEDYVPNQ